jgi:dTDP-4-dehydrorhamnose 3,5-epimerase
MDKIILTPLKQIFHPKGDIYHGMKKSDIGFDGFGEAYFSTINKGEIKGWKKHIKMTLNLIVPIGEIEFIIYDDFTKKVEKIRLSQKNYQRLTIKPNLWIAFKGHAEFNMLLNLANIEHDSEETETLELEKIKF